MFVKGLTSDFFSDQGKGTILGPLFQVMETFFMVKDVDGKKVLFSRT